MDGRELHDYLEVDTRFRTWVKRRIKEYGFEDGLDFSTILSESGRGRPSKEYIFTLDTGKELGMVEKTEKGSKIRKHFIELEKKAKKQITSNANQFDLLRRMVDQMEQMDKRTRRAEQKASQANKGVEKLQDTFAQIDDDWRQYVNKVFSKIGRKTGDYRSYRKESYIMLDRRAGVDLQQRLKNKKKRMKRNGATKTAIKEANKLDVIEDSKKLTEIYVNIVQEFEAKHLNQEAS